MLNDYTIPLAIHILAAVLWVGGGVMLHITGRLAAASGDRQRMLQFSRDADFLGPRYFAPLSLTLIVAGVILVDKAGYEMSDLWITLAFIGWGISFLIGVGYYPRAGKMQQAAVEQKGVDSPEFMALYKQVATVNLVETAILVLVVIDMVVKPT